MAEADRITGLAAVVGARPRVLILGTAPGAVSLASGQYYAQPQNTFWRIIGAAIPDFPSAASYEGRLAALTEAGIALWDVMHSCVRRGSLDAAIEMGSAKANAFAGFFAQYPELGNVLFNGKLAETAYMRLVRPRLDQIPLRYERLPSTSPAHAALAFSKKLESWKRALHQAGVTVIP